jgi:hypothetical protein
VITIKKIFFLAFVIVIYDPFNVVVEWKVPGFSQSPNKVYCLEVRAKKSEVRVIAWIPHHEAARTMKAWRHIVGAQRIEIMRREKWNQGSLTAGDGLHFLPLFAERVCPSPSLFLRSAFNGRHFSRSKTLGFVDPVFTHPVLR